MEVAKYVVLEEKFSIDWSIRAKYSNGKKICIGHYVRHTKSKKVSKINSVGRNVVHVENLENNDLVFWKIAEIKYIPEQKAMLWILENK